MAAKDIKLRLTFGDYTMPLPQGSAHLRFAGKVIEVLGVDGLVLERISRVTMSEVLEPAEGELPQ